MEMNEIEMILSHVDHTLLKQDATWEQIRQILHDSMQYHTASACIPAAYVGLAKKYVGDQLPLCTVIGFPNGYDTTASKVFMAQEAVREGADEVDMVINIGWLKASWYDQISEEIRAVKAACSNRLLKVIIETCLLTQQEKIKMCDIVSSSGADYIKTSTGFATAGATKEDIILMKKHVAPHLKIKAAGGISSLADAREFLQLGADRLGTSRIVTIVKNMEKEN